VLKEGEMTQTLYAHKNKRKKSSVISSSDEESMILIVKRLSTVRKIQVSNISLLPVGLWVSH
jgi:hypothetical protein